MSHDLAGKSVLVVDDEPGLVELLKMEFEDFHAEVSLAESGQAALKLLKEKHFDIVFTDMKMPNGDGIWLISQIHEELHQTPQIYLCSGYNNHPSKYAKELGIIKVFSKPFNLLATVSEVVKNSQTEKNQ